MKIENDIKLGFKDVLIRPKRSTLASRSEVSLERTFKTKHSNHTITCVPIIAANMDTVGTFTMAKELAKSGMMVAVHKHYSVEDWGNFIVSLKKDNTLESTLKHVAVSIGISDTDFNNLRSILALSPLLKMICIDVANGYTESFVLFVAKVRSMFPDYVIIAGNVVTGEMTEQLILAGADIVKVGIGPGSVCTTRVKTGVGYPQLSAVIDCADSAHGLGGLIISDGGCLAPGDVAKAFGAGADFVMIGGMFAGHTESEMDIIEEEDGTKVMLFYGMSSKEAMERYSGGVAEYKASEGKVVRLPYRGSVDTVVRDILGGVRSACTYVGAKRLKELTKRTTFIRVMEQENTVFTEK